MKRKIAHILWCGRKALYNAYDRKEENQRKFFMWLFAAFAVIALISVCCGAWWQIFFAALSGIMAYACYKWW